MALTYPISSSQTDAKSPVDEQLMDDIRLNLEDIKTTSELAGASDYRFNVNGPLNLLPTGEGRLRLDGAVVGKASTFQSVNAYLERPGNGGTLEIDIRRATKPDAIITSLARQFSSSINSIARAGSGNSTQSVTRATAQISTQSITLWKSALNISSIVPMGDTVDGNDLVRYNFSGSVDSDWAVGDTVTFASCTNAANDGSFVIVKVKDDGGNNVVVSNASGVAQSGAAGTGTLRAYSYNFTNPVSSSFAATEAALFASHSAGANDGTLTIYAINQSGNNIIVKNPTGATQGGAAGTVDCNRWIFAFSSAASTTDYIVGETALTASHSSGGNNAAALPIKAVNSGGNNLILYNTAGVVQGGAAGTVNTNRWVYFFSSDPSAQVAVGYNVIVASASSAGNNGTFVVKEVNRSTSDNIVVFNESGVAQGGAAGTLVTKRMLVSFGSNQSDITTDSKIVLFGTANAANDGTFEVVQINRGGGSNYNAVIETTGAEQVGAAGRVVLETKSIFDTRPSFTIPATTSNFAGTHYQVSSNAVLNATRKTVTAGTLLFMDVLGIPDGVPRNLMVRLL